MRTKAPPRLEGEGIKTRNQGRNEGTLPKPPLLAEERAGVRRHLRKNETPTEHIFWQKIRNRQLEGLKFRRQHPIGKYIVDFYCPDHRLVIEIDGDIHYLDDMPQRDKERTKYIESQGYTVIRFTNNDIRNSMNGVADKILLTLTLSSRGEGTLNETSPSNPPSKGEGNN